MLNVLPATATTFDHLATTHSSDKSEQPGELIMTPKSQDTTTVAVGEAAAEVVRNYSHHHHHQTEDVEDAAIFFSALSVRCEFSLGAWDNATTTSSPSQDSTRIASSLSTFQQNPLQQFSSDYSRWGGNKMDEFESDSDESSDDDDEDSDDDDDDWEDDDLESVRLLENDNQDETTGNNQSSSTRVHFCECLVTEINEYPRPPSDIGHLLHYSGQEIQQFKNEYDRERRSMSLLERLGS